MKRISERRKAELEQYDAIKAQVAERDHSLCVRCLHNDGQYVKAWDVAHIVPRSAFGVKTVHLKHQEKNLCCLCRPCHKATETFNGRVELLNILQELHGYDYGDQKGVLSAPPDEPEQESGHTADQHAEAVTRRLPVLLDSRAHINRTLLRSRGSRG